MSLSSVVSGRVRRAYERARARLAQEAGSALLEVMASAAVLAIVSVGVLAGLDGAQRVSGDDKSRSVAASLAHADQDRLRGLRPGDLANRRETRSVPVASVPYRVVSRAAWVSDSTGTEGCTSTNSRFDYLKITSTVTWPNMRASKPVLQESLVSTAGGAMGAGQGSLLQVIKDRSGQPLPGVSVSLTGPRSLNDVTNEYGCVFFGFVPVGTYTRSFSNVGYVDTTGRNVVTDPAPVTARTITTLPEVLYDRAGSANVRFETILGGQRVPDAGGSVTLGNGSTAPRVLPSPGGTLLGTSTQVSAGGLFPFVSPYTAYSGNCSGANPEGYGAGPLPSFALDPGASVDIAVLEPAINVRVVDSLGRPINNARVVIRGRSCTGSVDLRTRADGRLDFPGRPFGFYDVCAQVRIGTRDYFRQVSNLPNVVAAGTALQTFTLTTSSSRGTCSFP